MDGGRKMMKTCSALVLALILASGASADLTLVGVPSEPIDIGDKVTITVASSVGGAYSGWLAIETPAVATFDGAPEFTPAGNPSGASTMEYWPDFGDWYNFTIVSFPPSPAIAAGDHILIHVIGVGEGSTQLRLLGDDGETVLDECTINVVPEPMTIALLGLGGLLLRRRE